MDRSYYRNLINNPELNLLINLTSQKPQNKIDQQIDCIDWNNLYHLAKFHGQTTLVNFNLQNYPYLNIPRNISDKFSDDSKTTQLFNSLLTKELLKIAAKLNKNRIRFVPFKGPILDYQEYRNIGLRMYTDLDFFIFEEDLLTIKDILNHLGYEQSLKINPGLEKIYYGYKSYCNFFNVNNGISVDLQWSTASNNLSFNINLKDLPFEFVKYKLNDVDLLTFSLETTLLILCQHGCKHGWSRLIWIYDIFKILENNSFLDWDKVFYQSMKYHSTRMLLTGLYLAHILYSAELVPEVRNKINKDSSVEKLTIDVIKYLNLIDPLISNSYNDKLFIQSIEKYSDKYVYTLNKLRPTPFEFQYNLPNELFYGYYIIRPLRLLSKNILKTIKW